MLKISATRALALLLLAILPAAAAAQEFNPITTEDLDRYLQRLNASDEQRLAALASHEQYMEQYKVIGEGLIAEYRAREMERRVPNLAEQRERLQLRERIERRIAAIDSTLFDAVEPLLSQEQREVMPRVRQMRQRDRLQIVSVDPDLARLVQELRLPPAALSAIEPILHPYEPAFTRALQERDRKVREGQLRTAEHLEQVGATGEWPDDPQRQREVMEQWSAVSQIARDLREEADREIRRINDQTVEQMTAVLDEPIADRIHVAYYTKLYQSPFALDSDALAALDAAAEHPELSSEQQQAASDLRDDLRSTLRSIFREQIAEQERFDEWRRAGERFEGYQEHVQRRNELTQRANDAGERAMTELEAILTPEQMAMVRADREPAAPRPPTPAERRQENIERRENALLYLPPPIAQHDLSVFLARLGVDSDPDDEVVQLHGDYFAQYHRAAQQAQRDLQQARQRLGAVTPLKVREQAHQLHNRKLDELRAADARFFDQLGDQLDTDAEPAHAMRRRQVSSAIYQQWFTRDTPPADIVIALLRDVQPLPEVSNIEHLLSTYERNLAPRLQLAAERTLAFTRYQELMEAVFELRRQLPEEEHRAPPRPFTGGELHRPLIEARQLNRRMVDQIGAILSHDQREQFIAAYRRAAAPNAAIDEDDAAPIIRKALESPELTRSQREHLTTLLAEHRAEHRRLTEELVDAALHTRELTDEWTIDRERDDLLAELGRAQDTVRRLQSEREELNARTKQRAAVIGG